MKRPNEGALRRVACEIREEAARQIGGFPKDELRKHLIGGWGEEFARSLAVWNAETPTAVCPDPVRTGSPIGLRMGIGELEKSSPNR